MDTALGVMKILLLSNLDWPSFQFLDTLLPKLRGHKCQVFLTRRVGSDRLLPDALAALGTKDQSILGAALGIMAKDEAASLEAPLVEAMQGHLNSAVEMVDTINQGLGRRAAEAFGPELIVSVRFGSILRMPAIRLPRHGVINLHSGLLPEYRGIMATFWAMVRQEARYGFTVHQIVDEGIDTGPIVSRKSLPLDLGLDYSTLLANLYQEALPELIGSIERVQQTGSVETHAPEGTGEYFGLPDQTAIERFENLGYRWWPDG